MSYTMPDRDSRWRRKSDGISCVALGCTGSNWIDNVLMRRADGGRSWHVRLENLWRKYEPEGGTDA